MAGMVSYVSCTSMSLMLNRVEKNRVFTKKTIHLFFFKFFCFFKKKQHFVLFLRRLCYS